MEAARQPVPYHRKGSCHTGVLKRRDLGCKRRHRDDYKLLHSCIHCIPSQVRGSDYSTVDNTLGPRPSIWRLDKTGYKLISENDQQLTIPGATDTNPRNLNDGEVLSFNFTVMLQMGIRAGDVLGFRLFEGRSDRIEHLPLLYKPGPTPGSFTPIIIANFNPTSDISPTEPSDVLSPSCPSDSEFKSAAK